MPMPPMPPGFRPMMGGPPGMPPIPNLPGMPPVPPMRPPSITTSSGSISAPPAISSAVTISSSHPQQQPKPLLPSAAAGSRTNHQVELLGISESGIRLIKREYHCLKSADSPGMHLLSKYQ
ncbi:uncharacterized protein [Asterias amurensis]|uniref:uncharacterized protein isoform X1 n=1 Tax=Asterias amurensis TaxID=7602 RepID=UPI003AB36666